MVINSACNLLRNSNTELFPKVATKFYIPFHNVCGSNFSTPWPNTCYCNCVGHSSLCDQYISNRYHLFIPCDGEGPVEVEKHLFLNSFILAINTESI